MGVSTIPSIEDFDRVLDAPPAERLPCDKVVEKLSAGDPERIADDDHAWSVLIAAGVRAEQVDFDMWPLIKRRAASIARDRVERERQAERSVIHLAAAFGVIVGVMLHTIPAAAAVPEWFNSPLIGERAGGILLGLIGLTGIVMAFRSRRERKATYDPHAEAFGDIPGER